MVGEDSKICAAVEPFLSALRATVVPDPGSDSCQTKSALVLLSAPSNGSIDTIQQR